MGLLNMKMWGREWLSPPHHDYRQTAGGAAILLATHHELVVEHKVTERWSRDGFNIQPFHTH